MPQLPLTTRTVDEELAKAKQRIAELERELEARTGFTVKVNEKLREIVLVTKGPEGELQRHSTHDAYESLLDFAERTYKAGFMDGYNQPESLINPETEALALAREFVNNLPG